MRTPFTGCGTALVTPFTSDGALDEPAITRLARRQVDAGMHFLVPCGTTGESPTLDARERLRVVELVVEAAAGRVPVMAGAGGYDTREVIHAVGEMAKAGATGILSVSPYYNKPTQEGLYQHYRAIAESTALPIMVYNVAGPHRVERRDRDAGPAGRDPEHHRRQGSVREHRPDLRRAARRCRPTSWCCPATTPSRCR